MRGRILLAKWGLILGTGTAAAQFPPPAQPPGAYTPGSPSQFPGSPIPPGPLPPLRPIAPAAPIRPSFPPNSALPGNPGGLTPPGSPGMNPVAQGQEIPLPQRESKLALNSSDVTLKRVGGSWQLWAGQRVLRDFGDHETDARDALRVFRDLRPTEWVGIGGPKPVVEYALVNGRPPAAIGAPGTDDPRNPNGATGTAAIGGANVASVGTPPGGFGGPAATGAGAKAVIPIDLKTVRVEPIRGVWCLRDDDNVHFNFGPNRADADQALAVVRRYGFNRVGVVGAPAMMSYFFVGPDAERAPQGPLAKAALQAQIDGLNRVGIPVPGVGFVGEMVGIDPRKVEVRKNGGDWVVVAGGEVVGSYGPVEWAARDAARTIADARFTEFCKVGSAGLTFFLVNGKAPNRVPFAAQGRHFDPGALKVQQVGGSWAVTENGRHLFDCATPEEGDTLVRVVRHFGFDQLCHLGPTQKLGVSFLAKGR